LKRTFGLDFDNNFFPLGEGASLNLVLHIFKLCGFDFDTFFKNSKKFNLLKKSGSIYTLAKIAYCTSTKIYMKLKLGMHRQIVLQII
jgi:hypothetical protein